MSRRIPRRRCVLQLGRFGIVGVAATLIHALIYSLAVLRFALSPLIANPIAFLGAFAVSFLGHRYWTFAGTAPAQALPRFFVTALLGLACNQTLTWLFVTELGGPPLSALLAFLVITPGLIFVLAKYWAFAAPGALSMASTETR